jgi:methylmalonyl-CoA/ethylmalonyl-CoA epimerase
MELDHVGIFVRDLEAAKRFASETLGLELEREGPQPALGLNTAFFRAGPALIELIEHQDADTGEAQRGGAQAKIDHLALRVGDLEAARERLASDGGAFDQENGPIRLGPNDNYFSRAETTHGVRLQLMHPAAGDQP